jgi:hypothetical protein
MAADQSSTKRPRLSAVADLVVDLVVAVGASFAIAFVTFFLALGLLPFATWLQLLIGNLLAIFAAALLSSTILSLRVIPAIISSVLGLALAYLAFVAFLLYIASNQS